MSKQDYVQTDLTTCVVGQYYWVINGHWRFKVLSKDDIGLRVKYAFGIMVIPYDSFYSLRLDSTL